MPVVVNGRAGWTRVEGSWPMSCCNAFTCKVNTNKLNQSKKSNKKQINKKNINSAKNGIQQICPLHEQGQFSSAFWFILRSLIYTAFMLFISGSLVTSVHLQVRDGGDKSSYMKGSFKYAEWAYAHSQYRWSCSMEIQQEAKNSSPHKNKARYRMLHRTSDFWQILNMGG